ncbi:potassium channel family protein [Paraclostridium sordellii]|uniref:potassium channel family protein n=2 Tax=Paraclostridium sordellii TaxID=1505 RepID=UPI0005E7174A|nr:potassium channel family protein [Paeniclostridium sordellii]CEO06197.1 potassium channel subunit [[Clostridium] sordellii] [Paeniclostridium sordellii]CEP86425.1 potassium channel subunit [[Clostridium] sordellii] [Paeniclostridium sordellii]CEP96676.1 potassium channel subunit [[Clostridium] sordellii] [Paeniclostridium sordellii]CEP99858.1 potassium channel subunit [[Clostridium] sordellii] [Paeniclostridium sordellii]
MVTTKKKHIAYNLMMAFLSLLIAVILIVQLTLHLSFNINVILTNTACIIWIIFVVDYITRFVLSNDKKSFVKNNIIDLISIIPFHTFFILLSNYGILKLGKYVILLKLVMVLRIVAIIKKSDSNFYKLLKTNNFSYTLFIALFMIFLSSVTMSYFEHWNIGDSLWWSIVTVTTVGYGYICPKTFSGRIIACILMIFGIGFIGSLTSTLSTYFIKKENIRHHSNKHKSKNNYEILNDSLKDVISSSKFSNDEYKDKVILDIVNRLENFDNLSKDDINTMCNILSSLKND